MTDTPDDLAFGRPLGDVPPDLLTARDRRLFEDVVEQVVAHYGARLHSIKLVGSRARGTARPDSDHDVLVFLDACDHALECPPMEALAGELEARHGVPAMSISPLSREQFLGLDAKYAGITAAFRRDAITLWPGGPPSVRTERLTLRPLAPDDAADVQRLAGDPRVALMTLHIPQPYEDGMAEAWIASHPATWRPTDPLTLAIDDGDTGLVGCISLQVDGRRRRAELGYWIAHDRRGRGYATEAARALVDFGFRELDLARIEAHCFPRNPASARVLEKLGMTREGLLRAHAVAHGRVEDLAVYAVLAGER